MHKMFILSVALLSFAAEALGHGMVMDPPNRSSMWRFDPSAPPNYEDDENFCGGMATQWEVNGGKCGVCGDDFRDSVPRENENTGKFGRGKIGKTYQQGSVMTASVLLTTNHWGYFEFSLCQIANQGKPETDDCFIPLKLADGSDKYQLKSHEDGYYKIDLQLPAGLTCTQCTLRWSWTCGNNWGECEDGHEAMGCGPQETFRSCSDISIV